MLSAVRTVLFGTQARPSFLARLITDLFASADGSATITSTRALAAYQTDFEGKLNLVPSGATREQGARYVRNYINRSENTTDSWTTQGSGAQTDGFSDPFGGTSATRVVTSTAAVNSGTAAGAGGVTGYADLPSLWLRGELGGEIVQYGDAANRREITLTTSWRRISGSVGTSFGGTFVIYSKSLAQTWYFCRVQLENVTGQANQNPSEYVSVGVLSAPWHGANVDGVKYFNTLNGNTVASNVVTEATGALINSSTSKFAVLPGVAGSYFSTPDSVANSITGDIDIRVTTALPDYTATSVQGLASKGADAWNAYINTNGNVHLDWWETAGTLRQVNSAAANSVTDGTQAIFRVTLDVDNGSGGHTVQFLKSTDAGATWSQIGTNKNAGAFTTSIRDTAGVLAVGGLADGTTYPATGNIYRAQIYNGINGTLAVDFNPNLSTSAQTFTAATGEVWTTNGGARIFGNTHATYGIVAPWDANGPVGLLTEATNTNSILQSSTLGTTWTVSNAADMNAVTANAYVSVDGTTTMGKLQPKATTAVHSLDQAFTFTAAKYTTAVDLRYVPATPQRWVALILNDGTTTWGASFDLLNGVVGAVSAGATSAIEATAQANVYRVSVQNTANAAAAAGTVKISLNATDTATLESAVRAGTETLGAGMVQHEVGTIKSSRILTTTVAVTRPASVAQYVSAGNLSATAMTIAMEITPSTFLGSTSAFHFATYVDADNYTALLSDGTNLIARKRIAGANTDATIAFTRTVGTTVKAVARFDTTNGIDVWLNGTKGTGSATLTASQIGTNFQIGGDGNGANQDYSAHRDLEIYRAGASDAECAAMSIPGSGIRGYVRKIVSR